MHPLYVPHQPTVSLTCLTHLPHSPSHLTCLRSADQVTQPTSLHHYAAGVLSRSAHPQPGLPHMAEVCIPLSVCGGSAGRFVASVFAAMWRGACEVEPRQLVRVHACTCQATVFNCTAQAGDVLYIPSYWWHEVRQRQQQQQLLW